MGKTNLSKIVKDVRMTITKHSPEILTGLGIAGMTTTVILAVRATPKALILIEEEKRKQNHEFLETAMNSRVETCERIEKLAPTEVIKVAWKCYVPAVVTGAVSIACLIGASSVNGRRNAALATAYALSETALKDYQEKVVEVIGEKKEQAVRDEVAKTKIERDPISKNEIVITDKGNTLCYDVISGRYFKGDIDKLKKAANELSRQMLDEMYVSLNDFYFEIGLNSIKIGDDLGWNIDNGCIDLSFSAQLAEDGTPCLVVDYHVAPRYDYRRLM